MIITKSQLLSALKRLLPVIPRRGTLPALECIHISRDLHGSHLAATDLERACRITLPAPPPGGALERLRAKRGYAFLIPAATLRDCAQAADKDSTLAVTEKAVTFQCQGQAAVVPSFGPPAAEFPDLPSFATLRVAGALDPDAIARCGRCMSRDEARWALQGVCWRGTQLIGTDGRRLHIEEGAPACPTEEAIIPAAFLPLIESGMEISVGTDRLTLSVQRDTLHITLHTKLIEGRYPNTAQVIPEPCGHHVRIDHEATAQVVRQLLKTSRHNPDARDSTALTLQPSPGRLTLAASWPGAPALSVPALLTGDPTPTAVNAKFLLEALENGARDLSWADATTPLRLTGHRRNLHILMPMRLDAPTPFRKSHAQPATTTTP